jgi:hypothetical protein
VSGWEAAVSGARRGAALEAALDVGRRIGDHARVQEALVAAAAQTGFPRTVHWEPHDVAQGDAGLALTCAYFDRCFPGAGWDVVAHHFLVSAARSVEGVRLPPSLFSGLGGLGFVAMMLSRGGARYGRLAAAIEAELVPETHRLAQSVRHRHEGLAAREFDVISGLAGIAAYLLAHRATPAQGAALKHALVALVELVSGPGDEVPRWMTPPELMGDEAIDPRYPQGSLNCGLAHGIPGPLAVLALALSDGAPIDGLRQAVAGIAAWTAGHRCDDRWGVNWPTMVTLPESQPGVDEPSRAAWCYGSPGVARALWLAGTALPDEDLKALAIESMESVYRRPITARQIDSPTFCHGVAGLLQITLRFFHDTRLAVFAEAAAELADQLLDAYEPDDALLGFRCIEPGGNLVDQAGLLDGAPGVALALLAASTTVEPTWDRLFLLA